MIPDQPLVSAHDSDFATKRHLPRIGKRQVYLCKEVRNQPATAPPFMAIEPSVPDLRSHVQPWSSLIADTEASFPKVRTLPFQGEAGVPNSRPHCPTRLLVDFQFQLMVSLCVRMSVVVFMLIVFMPVRIRPMAMKPMVMPEEETFMSIHSEGGECASNQKRKNAEWWLHGSTN